MTDPYRDPTCTWRLSPNRWPNRNGFSPNYVSEQDPAFLVLHTEDCASEQVAVDIFMNTATQRSAHYGVLLVDGPDDQFVDEGDAAWHSGNGWMNENSSGFEHEDDGNYNGPRTPILYIKSMKKVAAYCQRRHLPCDRQHVIKHSEVAARVAQYGMQARGITSTGCPDSLNVDLIVQGAQLIIAGNPAAAFALVGTVPQPAPEQILHFDPPITGQVIDITAGIFTAADGTKSATTLPDNDTGFYDFNQAPNGYTSQNSVAGQSIPVDRAKLVGADWYWGVKGSTWAINDNALDTTDAAAAAGHPGKVEPPDFVVVPPVVIPPVIVPPVVVPPVVVPPVIVTPADVYTARSSDLTVLVVPDEATDLPAVLAAADAWVGSHRGQGLEVLKNGQHFQTLDPIPPTPLPDPIPPVVDPGPPPVVPVKPGKGCLAAFFGIK